MLPLKWEAVTPGVTASVGPVEGSEASSLSPAFASAQLLTLSQNVFALVDRIGIGYLITVRSSDEQLQVFY